MTQPRWPLVVLIVAVLPFACTGDTGREEQGSVDAQAVEVQVAAAGGQDRPDVLEAVGTVRASRTVAVASKILSQIRAIHVEEGQRVQAGQRLIELDGRELASAVEAAAAARAEMISAIQAADHALESAQAQLALSEAIYTRFLDLLSKESVSRQEYDEAEARVKSARAAVEGAKAQKQQAASRQAQAEARIASADVMLGYATIDSPVTGVVVERLADPGSLAAPGQAILRIEEAGAYRLEVAAPSSLLELVQVGQTIQIAVDALGDAGMQQGKISGIVPEIDPASRTCVVKVSLPSKAAVRSGLYGRAFLPVGMRTVLAVPAEAVAQRGQLRSVVVVKGNVARQRLVTLGDLHDGKYEVLSGLDDGELVVLHSGAVADGVAVRLRADRQGGAQ